MGLEEYKGVFVFAQQVDNVLDGVAFSSYLKRKRAGKGFKHRSNCSIDWLRR